MENVCLSGIEYRTLYVWISLKIVDNLYLVCNQGIGIP